MNIRGCLCICLIPVSAVVLGCSTYRAQYDIGLTLVDRPAGVEEKYGEYDITQTQEAGPDISLFEDGLVKIVWTPTAYDVAFDLTNKSDGPVRIVWDKAQFVDSEGNSHRMVHQDVSKADAEEYQAPAEVAAGGVYKDAVFPAGSYVYRSGMWHKKPLFPALSVSRKADGIEEESSVFVGKSIKIVLPLEAESTTSNYTFTFKVSNVEVN